MMTVDILKTVPLPEQTAAALQKIALPAQFPTLEDIQKSPDRLKELVDANNGLLILRLFLEWIPALQMQYQSFGIPESIFRDNLTDITLWAEDYWEKHGTPGFAEWEWVANTFLLRVFRLGRLQFEPSVLEKDALQYPVGTTVLEVHIPAGEPLDDSSVEESMKNAPVFFETYFRRQFSLFRCHSWLLSPQLKTLLPEQSRILRFQNLFTVYGEDSERQAEERVFGYLSEDPALYPEETSLQRSMKQALLDGQTVGMGMGIRRIP